MNSITVTVRKVYGNAVIYPACPASRNFAAIAGTKTLTLDALRRIKDMGYTITERQESQLPEGIAS
jgi:hypothetical protein